MTLRTAIIRRAEDACLSAFDLARLVRKRNGCWIVSTDHMERYFSGDKDMTGEKLDKVMEALGLGIVYRVDFDFQFCDREDGNK